MAPPSPRWPGYALSVAGRDIILVGASAGGLAALRDLIPLLPADLQAAVVVMMHRARAPDGRGDILPGLVQRFAQLAVGSVVDGEKLRPGRVYIAPPGLDVLFHGGGFQLTGHRPARPAPSEAIDVLFRSAAAAYGERVSAVVLSGMLRDGTAGLWEVRRRGGVTIAQEPREALCDSMPRTALDEVPLHYCLPLAAIGPKLVQLSKEGRAVPRRARVLIVQDEGTISVNLGQRLADLGYDVVGSVRSGEEVLRVATEVAPDVVLMDVPLAGAMTGTEAARILWKALALPIVFLTAYSDEQTVDDATESMPYGFVVKPYRSAQIHATLRLALDRRERETRALRSNR
jgi:chemotaxis response regulator CheB